MQLLQQLEAPEELGESASTPEHSLLAALLENTLQDLRGCGVQKTTRTKKNARLWLLDDKSKDPFSFLWICDMLSMDPVSLRCAMLQKSVKR